MSTAGRLFFVSLLCVGADAPTADLERADSTSFSYRYEGDQPLMVRGDTINLGGGYFGTLGGATLRSDRGVMSVTTPTEGGLMLRNPFWETDSDHDEGWTWEVRLRVDAANSERSFQVRLGDCDTGHAHLGLQFWPDRLQGFGGTVLVRRDFTEFTTLRVAQAGDTDHFVLWLDGEPLAVKLAEERLLDTDVHWLGDGSSAAAGTTYIDHIRWTGLGAFAPPADGEADIPTRRSSNTVIQPRTQKGNLYTSPRRDLPDFGLMLNDDGDGSFPSSDPTTAKLYREAMIDALAGTPVKTLMVSVGMGSDTLYYPTKAADAVGWRETSYDERHGNATSEEQLWAQRLTNIKNGIAAGFDSVRVAGERARRHGMRFVPSYRMNDDHFMFDPLEYPMTGKFWIEHHERMKIRDSPILSDPRYGQLLDYSHADVRDFRRGIIFEMIERYADVMDGIELDFNRVQVFFPRGQAERRAHLMTQLVADVRQRLDRLGEQEGREFYLFVRVPPTLKNCTWAGLDVAEWLERRLVDVVIPAQLMTLSHDMPIDEFVAAARSTGAQVYPTIYPRTNWTWPLTATSNYERPVTRRASPRLFRGAAANYWSQGADGFQLFNFRTIVVPQPDIDYRVMRDLASPACLNQADKVFAVTPGYYLDYEDTYQYRKQLPVALNAGDERILTLQVIESLDSDELKPTSRRLRIGLRDVTKESKITLRLNSHTLHDGPLGDVLLKTADSSPASAPTHYIEFALAPSITLRPGANRVALSTNETGVHVVECQLGLFYRPQPMAIFEP